MDSLVQLVVQSRVQLAFTHCMKQLLEFKHRKKKVEDAKLQYMLLNGYQLIKNILLARK